MLHWCRSFWFKKIGRKGPQAPSRGFLFFLVEWTPAASGRQRDRYADMKLA
jgi:hypothetical protein